MYGDWKGRQYWLTAPNAGNDEEDNGERRSIGARVFHFISSDLHMLY